MPLPAPLPPWARWLIQIAPAVAAYLYNLYEDYETADLTANPGWMHVQVVGSTWSSGARTTQISDWVNTWDFVKITDGEPAEFAGTDHDAVVDLLEAFYTSALTSVPNQQRLDEFKTYRRFFNPLTSSKPFGDMGPPLSIIDETAIGGGVSGSNPLPAQCASVLRRGHSLPHNQGRVYLPAPAVTQLTAAGQYQQAYIDAIISAAGLLVATAADSYGMHLVTPVTRFANQPFRALVATEFCQMDSLPDIQRRRRDFSDPAYEARVDILT